MMRRAVLLLCLVLAACQAAPPPAEPVVPVARSRPTANRDDFLQAQAARRLATDPAFRSVAVEVWGSNALLIGAVVKPEQKRRAADLVKGVEGMSRVINEVLLTEARDLDRFRPDAAAEEALRRHLGVEGRSGLVVRVVNGIAFLFGAVASPGDSERLKEDAGDLDGIKWVVPHLEIQAKSTN